MDELRYVWQLIGNWWFALRFAVIHGGAFWVAWHTVDNMSHVFIAGNAIIATLYMTAEANSQQEIKILKNFLLHVDEFTVSEGEES